MSAASGPPPAPAAPVQPVADVAVIGAGVVGSAIARELAGYELSVTLLEARADVGDGTSKANTAILHTGFDAKPGTLESRLVRAGYDLLSDYASQAGIPVERTGALLVAWATDELAELPVLKAKAAANGYDRCEIVDAAEVYRQIPDLGAGALGGLTVPDESIICTWTTSLALATDARLRGTDLRLAHPVRSVSQDGDVITLHCDAGDVPARWVVNAAGLGCDLIDQMFGYDRFHVTPRRGELLVFDKLARPLVNKIVLPVPTARGRGSGGPHRDRHVGGRLYLPAGQGSAAHAAIARGGSHRELCRAAGCRRCRGLPDRSRRREALRPGRRYSLDRADLGDGNRRACP
jgi:glycerol-3-phosphate dehydrogenase